MFPSANRLAPKFPDSTHRHTPTPTGTESRPIQSDSRSIENKKERRESKVKRQIREREREFRPKGHQIWEN